MAPVLLVAVGGVLGSLARAGAGAALPHEPGTWSWSTLLVNAVGAAALVLLVGAGPSRPARLLLGTGLLGGFTTFSAFTVDAALLAEAGSPVLAAAYVLVGLVTLVGGALVGLALSRAVRR